MVIFEKLTMSQKNLNNEINTIISLFNQKKFNKISKIPPKILEKFNEQIEKCSDDKKYDVVSKNCINKCDDD